MLTRGGGTVRFHVWYRYRIKRGIWKLTEP
jgi:hypothetical protein